MPEDAGVVAHAEHEAPARSGLLPRGAVLVVLTLLTAAGARAAGFTSHQVVSSSIFIMIILATLLFWKFRLAIAFIGIGALLGCKVLTLETFIESSELDIILFLVGMMVTVGVLKELGLFSWIIQCVINMRRMSGFVFIVTVVIMSALMACAVDEVTSIVFVATLIFQVCDTLKIRPTPFILIAVMGTNVGSAGTMLGNPVGIMIGLKGGFTFLDFLVYAFPVMAVSLAATLGILLFWYREEIRLLDERLEQRREMGLGLGPLVRIPYRRSLAILVAMLVLIASHHALETLLGVEKNTILIVVPLVMAGVLMIWRHERARHYIETEVEWWTLLFFMMLFAVAGSLEHTGVTARVAHDFAGLFGRDLTVLAPVVVGLAAVGSAFVDNIVFVAAFIPVVKELGMTPLWWALLFGACFGGNITMIGSTANIVALGMLEKRYRIHVAFLEWLRIGVVVGVVSCVFAAGAVLVTARWMPARWTERHAAATTVEPREHASPERSGEVVPVRHEP